MCGLVGMAGNLHHDAKAGFKDFLDVCQTRGRDGTGVFVVDRDGSYRTMKSAGPPMYLYERKGFDAMLTGSKSIIAGHTRAGTVGGMTLGNTHPFDFGDFIGMHNGTLKNYRSVLTDPSDYGTDSECLLANIRAFGADGVIPELDAGPVNAYALVWYDGREGTLNFYRNSERPLYFIYSEDEKTLYWASEPWFFYSIWRRGKVEFWRKDKHLEEKVFKLPENEWWKVRVDWSKNRPEEIFTWSPPVKLEGKEPPPPKVISRGGWFGEGGGLGAIPFLQTKARGNTPADTSTTTRSTGGHTTSAAASSGSGTALPITPNGAQNSPSPVPMILESSPTTVKESCSLLPKTPSTSFSALNPRLKGHVSFREVLGSSYITNNVTGKEWSESEFFAEAGTECRYCGQAALYAKDVHKIYEDIEGPEFLCTHCINPPVLVAEVI